MAEQKQNWGNTTGSGIMMVFAMMMMLVFMGTIASAAPANQYVCPICGEKFTSYSDLYQHFTTAHPTEPITILWE